MEQYKQIVVISPFTSYGGTCVFVTTEREWNEIFNVYMEMEETEFCLRDDEDEEHAVDLGFIVENAYINEIAENDAILYHPLHDSKVWTALCNCGFDYGYAFYDQLNENMREFLVEKGFSLDDDVKSIGLGRNSLKGTFKEELFEVETWYDEDQVSMALCMDIGGCFYSCEGDWEEIEDGVAEFIEECLQNLQDEEPVATLGEEMKDNL